MRLIALIVCAILLGGCASVISPEVLKQVEPSLSLKTVREAPEKYIGRTILWGGIIVSVEHLKESTIIEVFQTELTSTHSPSFSVDSSQGRFLIEASGFLDNLIYTPKRGITVAGVIKGVRVKKIDNMSYTYPVVKPLELHLFDPPEELYPLPPAWWYYYPPYYPPSPYYYH